MGELAIVMEIGMVLCFGASWPFNIVRAYKARTAKGTSISFTLLIAFGYVCGMVGKICEAIETGAGYWDFLTILAFVFYVINLVMVSLGIAIYFRNKRYDAKREAEENEKKDAE